VRYLFIPEVDQNDLPIYDFTDRISQRSLFTYGFTSRLLAKLTHVPTKDSQPLGPGDLNSFTGASRAPFGDERTRGTGGLFDQPEIGERGRDREEDEETDAEGGTDRARRRAERADEEGISRVVEWAQFSLYQSYDVEESLRTDRTDHLSDVDVGLRVNPVDYFSLLTTSAIDSREAIVDAANIGFLLRDPRPRSPYGFLQSGGRASVAVSYRFISNQTLQELDGGVMVPFADTLSAFYQTRYDALAREFLENRFGFRLISQCQCWIFDFYAVDQANPDEFGVRTQVTLVGLGSIGRTR
jgi:hypothetical protein